MTNFIARAVLCCSFLLITSCMFQNYPARGDRNFMVCKASCDKRLNACTKLCRNNCPQCLAAASQSTARTYAHYVHEQYVKGGFIALQLNSFRDPLQCRKTTCNCRADYQICMQSCGGVISKRLQHVPLCS